LREFLDEQSYDKVPVEVGETTYTFEFPKEVTESERKEILDAKLRGSESEAIKALNEELAGMDVLRFRWDVREVVLPYKYPVALGIILMFLGAVFVVLSIDRGYR
jgi:uncharacterized membrane protein